MRALIVDDSRTVRLVLRRILGDLGFDVSEAEDGQDAFEQLSLGYLPDVALVDWNMPRMTGIQFVRTVRANPAWNDIVLVMQTTETEMDFVSSALEAGANEYVMKPFTAEILADKLCILGLVG